MRELSFNIEAARRFGVDGAVMLQGMAAWISKNRANERHFHDGRWWTYNSQDALVKLFPFWSRRQIQRIVKALNTEGALLLGNYSDDAFFGRRAAPQPAYGKRPARTIYDLAGNKRDNHLQ